MRTLSKHIKGLRPQDSGREEWGSTTRECVGKSYQQLNRRVDLVEVRTEAGDVLVSRWERTPEDKDGGVNIIEFWSDKDEPDRYYVIASTSRYGRHRLLFSDVDYDKCGKYYIGFVGTMQAEADAEVGQKLAEKEHAWDQHIYSALVMRKETYDEMLANKGLEDREKHEHEYQQVLELVEEYQTKVELV